MTAALARLVRPDVGPRCGVEQEFAVRDAAGRAVDVREYIDAWPLGRRLDPGDPHAARGGWGGVVTADGPEAEVVAKVSDLLAFAVNDNAAPGGGGCSSKALVAGTGFDRCRTRFRLLGGTIVSL